MEKFKIRASNEKGINNNIINIVPDIISSDIPYYIEIETTDKAIVKLRNKYLSSNEQKKEFEINKVVFKIGITSGKVYEISIGNSISSEQLKSVLNKFLKEKIAINTNKKSRFYNNIKFTTEILKELNSELKNRSITKNIVHLADSAKPKDECVK